MKPKVLIMSGYGINCEHETAHAFEKAGGSPGIVHVNDLIAGKKKMRDYQIMVFPGGFAYGDDTGAGNAYANKVRNNLWEDVTEFIESEKLVLGICNGFQILTALGLFALPKTEYGEKVNALLPNTSNRYICRWVNIRHNNSKCVFTKGIDKMYLPVAHGEGRFYTTDENLKELRKNKQVVFTYCDSDGKDAKGINPINPNGAMADVAGICDRTGRVMGMMPHPERALYSFNRPDFHLLKESAKRKGKQVDEMDKIILTIFKNMVDISIKKM